MKEKYIQTGRINQKLETREQILESAQYFLSNGHDFTLEDVAKKAKISRATIYRYYSNKDVLANEAVLDIKTKNPEVLFDEIKNPDFEKTILEIQEYYNTLAIDHEPAFRKYLSTIITSSPKELKRGARRKKTLELALKDTRFSNKEKEDLANLLTILMGIEPLIVAKDVAGLNNEASKEVLTWGAQLILKGFFANKS